MTSSSFVEYHEFLDALAAIFFKQKAECHVEAGRRTCGSKAEVSVLIPTSLNPQLDSGSPNGHELVTDV